MSNISGVKHAITPRAFELWNRNLGGLNRLDIQMHQTDKQLLKLGSSVVGLVSDNLGQSLGRQACTHELAIWRLQNSEIRTELTPAAITLDGTIMRADRVDTPSTVEIVNRQRIKAKDAIVWLFDDDADIAESLSLYLYDLGFTNIKPFTDPREWTKQGNEVPDLVITDMNMKVFGLNGRQLIDAMHDKYASKRPYFILSSALQSEENRSDARYLQEHRATKFFGKPCDLDGLTTHLENLFDF